MKALRSSKRYHPPQTPCERLLHSESIPEGAKVKLREVAGALDPLKLLEEMRAVQAHLAALADGETPPSSYARTARSGRVRGQPLERMAGRRGPSDLLIVAKPRYLRSLQKISPRPSKTAAALAVMPSAPLVLVPVATTKLQEKPTVIYAKRRASAQALDLAWPMVCRRLESFRTSTHGSSSMSCAFGSLAALASSSTDDCCVV